MSAVAPYWNPYKAGFALGLVLLATFVLIGRGLGASGAFLRVTAEGVRTVAPAHAAANPVLRGASDSGDGLSGWLVVEIAGVLIGGALSAGQAGRWRSIVERGPGTVRLARLGLAFGGGAIMGIGARLARGCTSGQALSGGAVLAAGSWVFMLALFASAYAASRLTRRQWL